MPSAFARLMRSSRIARCVSGAMGGGRGRCGAASAWGGVGDGAEEGGDSAGDPTDETDGVHGLPGPAPQLAAESGDGACGCAPP